MQHLRAPYTEIWISSPLVPLVQFADRVQSIASSGIDLVGIGDLPVPQPVAERLQTFDEIVSWYGAARPEFQRALQDLRLNCHLYPALPPVGFGRSATDFFAEQIGLAVGLRPSINVSAEASNAPAAASRNSIIIHPFSGGKRKNWPLEYFRQLACDLPLNVEWIAGPDEPLAEAHRFDNLLELATWMRGARLYIGNDAGITHLAAAIGLPVLAIFGPTDPNVWAPPGATVMRSESLSTLHPNVVRDRLLPLLTSLAASNVESVSLRP